MSFVKTYDIILEYPFVILDIKTFQTFFFQVESGKILKENRVSSEDLKNLRLQVKDSPLSGLIVTDEPKSFLINTKKR